MELPRRSEYMSKVWRKLHITAIPLPSSHADDVDSRIDFATALASLPQSCFRTNSPWRTDTMRASTRVSPGRLGAYAAQAGWLEIIAAKATAASSQTPWSSIDLLSPSNSERQHSVPRVNSTDVHAAGLGSCRDRG